MFASHDVWVGSVSVGISYRGSTPSGKGEFPKGPSRSQAAGLRRVPNGVFSICEGVDMIDRFSLWVEGRVTPPKVVQPARVASRHLVARVAETHPRHATSWC